MLFRMQTFLLPLVLGMIVTLAAALPTQAAIFEEILFNDTAGTAIENLVNNANPGNMFDVDTDNTGVVTNGLGQLDANTKNNVAFGTNYIDTAAFTTGRMFGVMEFTWDFQSVFDGGEPEQVRLSMINMDPRNTEITAEFRIERTAAGPVINGQTGGTGATDLPNVLLNGGSLTQSDKFIAVIDANLDTDVYEILYSSDAGATFLSAGTGMMDPARGIESLRMALNNDLVNDNILIDRVYLTDDNPITSIDALTLEVNTITGNIQVKNETATTFDIDSYRIESPDPDHDLNFTSWNSFSDQTLDAVDGPDLDAIVGNGIGETWDEAAGSDNDVLAESFLLGSSVFGAGRSETLGSAFQTGGEQTLTFQYRDSASGAVSDGTVVYVSTAPDGDFDGDLDVDGRDFLTWQRGFPTTPHDAAGLADWEANFGTGIGPLGGVSAVPEPATAALLIGMSLSMLARRRAY